MAAQDILHGDGLECRQWLGRAVAFLACSWFLCPLVVTVVVAGLIVVAAGVLVVALAHAVGHVLVAVLGVDIAHEAFLLSTMRTAELAGLMARQFFILKLITIIFIHDGVVFSDFCWRFSFVVGATIYIGGSDNKQKSFRGQKAKAVSSEA